MKKVFLTLAVMISALVANAQESEFSIGADVVSSYVWRGQYLGGAAVQPGVGYSIGGLSVGAWGSVNIVNPVDSKEFDLAVSYTVAGLTVGITDYYIVSQTDLRPSYFNYSTDKGTAHTFELNLGYTLPVESLPLSLSWNTNFAGADGIKSNGKTAYSSYFEVSYPFTVGGVSLDAAVGLTPWETSFYGANGFSVINTALKASKEIKIADFTLPAFGQIVINPRTEDAFLVFGLSF